MSKFSLMSMKQIVSTVGRMACHPGQELKSHLTNRWYKITDMLEVLPPTERYWKIFGCSLLTRLTVCISMYTTPLTSHTTCILSVHSLSPPVYLTQCERERKRSSLRPWSYISHTFAHNHNASETHLTHFCFCLFSQKRLIYEHMIWKKKRIGQVFVLWLLQAVMHREYKEM